MIVMGNPSTAVFTKTREVACDPEITYASADHDAGVHTALACRSDLRSHSHCRMFSLDL
jgi:hypothetical protein